MKVYRLKEGQEYNPDTGLEWVEIKLPLEKAIKKYCGKVTLQIQWEISKNINQSFVVPASKDLGYLSQKISERTSQMIKNKFS